MSGRSYLPIYCADNTPIDCQNNNNKKIYHTLGIVPKFNSKIIERNKFANPKTCPLTFLALYWHYAIYMGPDLINKLTLN